MASESRDKGRPSWLTDNERPAEVAVHGGGEGDDTRRRRERRPTDPTLTRPIVEGGRGEAEASRAPRVLVMMGCTDTSRSSTQSACRQNPVHSFVFTVGCHSKKEARCGSPSADKVCATKLIQTGGGRGTEESAAQLANVHHHGSHGEGRGGGGSGEIPMGDAPLQQSLGWRLGEVIAGWGEPCGGRVARRGETR